MVYKDNSNRSRIVLYTSKETNCTPGAGDGSHDESLPRTEVPKVPTITLESQPHLIESVEPYFEDMSYTNPEDIRG